MKQLERVFKGLANRRRLAIIKLLHREKELPVAEIARRIKLSFTATSKHLGLLQRLDILDRRQQSLSVFYSLSSEPPLAFKQILLTISNSRE